MGQDPSVDFWGWCLRVYEEPGVVRAALRLQDRRGACVMLLLCICWRAARGSADGPAQLDALRDCVALVEYQALAPLRAARRALLRTGRRCPASQGVGPGRAVLAAELALERRQAERLARCPATDPAPDGACQHRAMAALAYYLQSLGSGSPRDHAVAGALARRALSVQVR